MLHADLTFAASGIKFLVAMCSGPALIRGGGRACSRNTCEVDLSGGNRTRFVWLDWGHASIPSPQPLVHNGLLSYKHFLLVDASIRPMFYTACSPRLALILYGHCAGVSVMISAGAKEVLMAWQLTWRGRHAAENNTASQPQREGLTLEHQWLSTRPPPKGGLRPRSNAPGCNSRGTAHRCTRRRSRQCCSNSVHCALQSTHSTCRHQTPLCGLHATVTCREKFP